MKVLLNSTCVFPLPPPGYAGTEWIVYDLAEYLAKFGHDVTVAAPKGSVLPAGVKHIPTSDPTWDVNAETTSAWPAISKPVWDPEKKASEFDIVHDHSFRGWPYMAVKDHPDATAKVCWTLHWYSEIERPPPVRFPNLMSLSNFMAGWWSNRLGVHVERVYNGINPDRYQYSDKKGDRYLFLSRIAPFKGAHEAVHFARETRVPVDIVGEDRFTGNPGYVMQVMESTKNTTAKYLGTVSHEDKLRLLKDAKALLFPALWDEPFGLVPLEAMVSGTPVIALRRGALPEVIVDGKTGFLCNSVQEMIECVDRVQEIDPATCRQHVLDHFTSEQMARAYERKYTDILGGKEW